MKLKIITLILILAAMPLFPQTDHIQNFFKCGMPNLSDYNCFNYDTLTISSAVEIPLSAHYNKTEIPKRFLARMMIMRTSALLAVKNDSIIYEQYWLDYNKNSLMNSFSVSKTIVSLLVGIAIGEGKINSLNQKVSDFFPYLFADTFNLRIVDLLTMSSGSSWSEDFANPMSDVVIAYYGTDLDSLIKNSKIIEQPGRKWKYQCGNTLILSAIIEKSTGTSIYKYAEEKLWQPIGATKNAYWGKDKPDGTTKSFCCFYATARDFAKLGLLVLNKGMLNGKQIVPKEYINAMIEPTSWLKYRKKNVDFYGLHIWLSKFHKENVPYFSGMFGQYIIIFPKQNAVVVRFGEMLNELRILPEPPDLPLYLKVSDKLIK
ncbi:MAG: serine hydrolase [Bacteroidales bacterium]|nr:serine hydrolase [Bacteroidales bacterium]